MLEQGDVFSGFVRPEDVLPRVGEFIRLCRQREELTLEELASKAGVPSSTISRLERTGLASTESLLKILFALNQIDALDAFLKERLRLVKFPKHLEDAKEALGTIRRVRHRRERP